MKFLPLICFMISMFVAYWVSGGSSVGGICWFLGVIGGYVGLALKLIIHTDIKRRF